MNQLIRGKFKLCTSDRLGYYVQSEVKFKTGDVVFQIPYNPVSTMTQHTLQISPVLHNDDMEFSGYLAHACNPNVSVDMKTMLITATRWIFPGDIICMDYAETEDVLFKQFKCNCGAHNCRGWITGRLEESDEQ